MTDPHAASPSAQLPLDAVRALVDERARYEQWLEALEARRDSAPAHVLDRVRQDYAGRLTRTGEALAAHAPALLDGVRRLAGRDDELRLTISEREDALAEIELRTLVGEYDQDDGARRRDEASETLARLREEAGRVGTELHDLRGLLERAGGEAAAGAAVAAGPGDGTQGGATPPAAPASTPTHDHAAASAAMDSAFAEATTGPVIGAPDAAALAALGGTGGDPDGAEFAGASSPTHHYAPPTSEATSGEGFAFGGGTLAAPAGGEGDGRGGAAGQEKTLRCPDCGALNFPTEWYCDRCGGELAVL